LSIKSYNDLKGTTAYIQIKSCYGDNIPISQKEGLWATTPKNTMKLLELYLNNDNVILIFSVNSSRKFYGYARMESLPEESLSVGHFGPMEQRFLGPCFKVKWLNTQIVSFEYVGDITNSLNGNLPVKISRDGQELSSECGEKLCKVLDSEQFKENEEKHSVESDTISTENSCQEIIQEKKEEIKRGKRFKKRGAVEYRAVYKPKKKKEDEQKIVKNTKEEIKV